MHGQHHFFFSLLVSTHTSKPKTFQVLQIQCSLHSIPYPFDGFCQFKLNFRLNKSFCKGDWWQAFFLRLDLTSYNYVFLSLVIWNQGLAFQNCARRSQMFTMEKNRNLTGVSCVPPEIFWWCHLSWQPGWWQSLLEQLSTQQIRMRHWPYTGSWAEPWWVNMGRGPIWCLSCKLQFFFFFF